MRNIAIIRCEELNFDVDYKDLGVNEKTIKVVDRVPEIYITSEVSGTFMANPCMQVFYDLKDRLDEYSPVDKFFNVLLDIDNDIAYYNLNDEELATLTIREI